MKRWNFLLGLVLLTGCGDKKPPAAFEMPPSPVQVANVEIRTVPLFFEAKGMIKPFQTAQIKPQVQGIISKVHFLEGAWVNEGDLLYTIDDAVYANRVVEMEAILKQDQAHLQNAQKKLERYKGLRQDLISQVEWDDLVMKIALSESMVQADLARLSSAKLDLSHCRIKAPISGKTGKTSLQAGNMAEGILVTLSQIDSLYVDFSITESELQDLSSEASVAVFATGSDKWLGNGKIVFLDHTLDAASGRLSARALLSEKEPSLWVGQTVRTQVIIGEKTDAKLIPLRAVKTNQSGPYTFSVKEDHTVEIRPLKLGPEDKGYIVVEEGLDGVSTVVTEGHLMLYPGSKVEEVK